MSKLRHNLSDESTRAATVLGGWMNIPGLVPEQEIVALFRAKSKRKKGDQADGAKNGEVIVVDA